MPWCGCYPLPGGDGERPAVNADTEGEQGNFSFDLSNANATSNGVGETGADAEAGAELYLAPVQACAVCHGTDAEGTAALGGPLQGTSVERLQEILAEGTDHRGGARPEFTDGDLANLEAFLATVGQDVGTNGTNAGSNGDVTGTNG